MHFEAQKGEVLMFMGNLKLFLALYKTIPHLWQRMQGELFFVVPLQVIFLFGRKARPVKRANFQKQERISKIQVGLGLARRRKFMTISAHACLRSSAANKEKNCWHQ